MPTVPRLTPQVAPQQLPAVRNTMQVSPEDFGAGFARPLQAVSEVAQREQQKADEALAYELDNELSSLGNDLLYNEQSGALLAKGRNAFGLPDTVGADYDKRAGEIGKKAASPRVKAVFERLRTQRREQVMSTLSRHVLAEGESYRKEQFTAGAASAITNAGLHYQDPKRIGTELAKGEEAVRKLNEGESPEAVEMKLGLYRSQFHAGVLDRMLANKDYRKARAYYGEIKGELTGQEALQAERAIHEATVRVEKFEAFDRIVASHPGDYRAQLAAAKKIEDAEVRDAVEAELDQNRAREEHAVNEAKRKLSEWAWSGAIDGNLKGREDIPADRWAALSAETKKGLADYWADKASGKDIQTDPAVYYGLLDMAVNDPEAFQGENILAYARALSPTDLKSVIRLQTTGRDDTGNTVFELRSKDQVVKDLLTGAGFDPSPKDKSKEAKRVAAFKSALDAELKAFQAQTGKKPTSTDIEDIGKKLLVKAYVQRSALGSDALWPDAAGPRFETPDGVVRAEDVAITDVPTRDRKAIEASLAKRNIPVTEENIVRLYVEALNAKPEAPAGATGRW